MTKQGWSIHCHHDILIEYCYDYDERVEAIKTTKLQNEIEIRLRLLKLLPQEAINELPERLVKADAERQEADAEWQEAYAEWQEAYAAWEKAYAEWQEAYAEREKADAERQEAYAERQKANAEWQKANAEWQKANAEWPQEEQDAFHKKWCGCKYWRHGKIEFTTND